MRRFLLTGAAVAALVFGAPQPTHAQDSALSAHRPPPPPPASGTFGAAAQGGASFDEIIDQDVADKSYSAAQGDDLKAKFDAAQQRLDASMAQTMDRINHGAVSPFVNNSDLMNQVSALNTGKVGGSPAEIQEQAQAIVDGLDQTTQTANAAIQAVQPLIQDYLDEADQLIAQRASLIASNPSISPAVKLHVQQESAKLHAVAEGGFDRAFGTISNQIQTLQSQIANNKQQLVAAYAAKLQQMSNDYGADISKWPQPPQQDQAQPAQPPPPPPPPPPPQPQEQADQSQDQAPATAPAPAPTTHSQRPTNTDITGGNGSYADNTNTSDFNAYRNQPGGVAPSPAKTANPPPSSGSSAGAQPAPGGGGGTGSAPRAEDEAPPPGPHFPTNAEVQDAINNPKPYQIPPEPPADKSGGGGGGDSSNPADAAAAGAAAGAAAAQGASAQSAPLSPEEQIYVNIKPGNVGGHLVGGDEGIEGIADEILGLDLSDSDASLAAGLQSVDYGDQATFVQVAPIYAGYQVGGSNGAFMVSPSLQVQAPSDLINSPSMQLPTGQSAALTSPSMQVPTGPPSSAPEPALCGE